MIIKDFLKWSAAGLIVGLSAEIPAKIFSLWEFHPAWYFFVQITTWEGIIMGGIVARYLKNSNFLIRALIGAILGGGFELINFFRLHLWEFPADTYRFIETSETIRYALILGVISILWGFFVPVTTIVAKRIFKA